MSNSELNFISEREHDFLEDSSKWTSRRGKKDVELTFINEDESNDGESSTNGMIGLRDRRVKQLQKIDDGTSSNLRNLSIGLQRNSSGSGNSFTSIRGVRIREVESAHHGIDEDASLGLNSTLNASTTLGSSFRISASGTLRLGNFMAINAGGIKRFGRQSKPSPASGSLPSFISESRAKDIKQELVMLDVLGRGASGVVQRALHLPSLQLVAVKHVRMFDADVRNQAVRELKSLYANMVPLAAYRRHKSSLQGVSREQTRDGGDESFLGDTLILGGSFGSSIGTSSVETPTDLGVSGTFSPTLNTQFLDQEIDSHDSTTATYSAHLIRLYDAYIDPRASTVSIVIEYCGGGSLQDIVDAGGCRDERVLARMAAHSLRGLAYLHAHRQLHRDIKPGNILCSTNGDNYKLADFGIVRQLGEGTQDQYAKTWVGTMVYMSPERMSSSSGSGYSFPADIWSLGLSIFSVALGRYPYQDIAYWELLSSIKDFPPPLHQLDEVYANSYIVSNESGGGVHSVDEAGGDSHHILPSPSKEFIDFLEQTLCRDPDKRPSAEMLLQHAFIVSNSQPTKRGSGSSLLEPPGWIGIPPKVEQVPCSKDSIIGIPLSESAELGPHCAKRPGAFSKLPIVQQETLVDGLKAMIYEIVADQAGVSHWNTFLALFGSSCQKNNAASHTLRQSLKLDEFSFNEYLLKRIGVDDISGHSSPSKPLPASYSVLEEGESLLSSAKCTFQLGIDDVRILSKQLGLPPLIVCAAFNDVILLKNRGLPIEHPKRKEGEKEEETDPILELLDADIAQSSGLGETFSTKFDGKQGVGPLLEMDNLELDGEEDEDDALDGIFFRPQGRPIGRGGGGEGEEVRRMSAPSSTTIFFKEGAHSVVIRELPSKK